MGGDGEGSWRWFLWLLWRWFLWCLKVCGPIFAFLFLFGLVLKKVR